MKNSNLTCVSCSPTFLNVLRRNPALLPSVTHADLIHMQNDVDMAIAGCRRTVEEYECAIQTLRSRRNSYSAICRLPDELLEEIFRHVADHDLGFSPRIHLSHVCRYWRALALGCARLWSCIVAKQTTPVELVRTFLLRSRNSPLDVRISVCPSQEVRPHQMLRIVLDELPRIHHFRASLPHSLYESVAGMFCAPAPHLRTLSLSYMNTLGSHEYEAMPLSADIFPGGLPSLKTLHVEGFRINWALSLVRPTVTQLSLHSPIRIPPNDSTAQALLEALHCMPALSALELAGYILPIDLLPDIPFPSSRRIVALPFLTHLRLSGKIIHFTWLLKRLELSPSINVDLSIQNDSAVPEHVLSVLGQTLADTLSPSGRKAGAVVPAIRHVGMYQVGPCISRSNNGFHIVLAAKRDAICEYFEVGEVVGQPRRIVGGERVLHITMSDKFLRDERPDVILHGLQLWHMDTVVLGALPMVKVSSNTRLLSSFMDCLFHMNTTQHLIVRDWEPWSLKELLAPNPDDYSDARFFLIPFPRLVQLILRGIPMSGGPQRGKRVYGESSEQQSPRSPAHVLRQMLQARSQDPRQIPKLKELFFSDCPGLTDDVVSVLEQEVERCIWYGIQG